MTSNISYSAQHSMSTSGKLNTESPRIELSVLPAVNFALQQNHISVVQSITISNPSNQDLENIDLQITSNLEAILPCSKHLEQIPAKESCVLKDIRLTLDAQSLAALTEKVSGLLKVSLTSEGVLLCEEISELTVLAFDEWPGYTLYPELLTAFVTPNHPEVIKLNAGAARFLEKWTGDPSFDAYQSRDPNRVLLQAAAVYAVLQEQNIVYSVPPASFQRYGQRVRLCDSVVQQKMGTCLDLTLLYAACLEAIGLHPLLILHDRHIFAGVWLEEMTFPEIIQDDVSLLTKRLADGINEVAVVECTAFVSGKSLSFDDARRAAERNLVGNDSIQCVIDVTRARYSGITPLPLRIQSETGWQIQREQVAEETLTNAPREMGKRIDVREGEGSIPATKKQLWERKLLDLGLRNTLINMRLTRMAPLLVPSVDDVEDALASGGDFFILPRPADWHLAKESISFEMMHELGDMRQLIESEFQNKRLRSILTEGELAHKIKELYRSSKAALEENGANALYLALGLLRWYETPRSTKPRYAPLILLPVELVRRGANRGYVIRLRDDEPQMNITLLEKLNQDFGIGISGLDPLPQDEHGVDTRQVFAVIRKAVMGQQRWDVLESAYLGIFSFSQFVMWNDIRNRSDELAQNKIVRSLMEGRLCWEVQPMTLGETVSENDVLLPLSADASQLYAIRAAGNGESFVLHGPPGTGKSQTITALIANSLAQGQSVLFVAEKMAALEVVQKRLTDIGIGPFCLELHSNKSKKKDVLEQLRQAMDVACGRDCQQYQRKAEQIAGLRRELEQYVTVLHGLQTCGMTVFELIDQYEKNLNVPNLHPFSEEVLAQMTPAGLEERLTAVNRLVAAAKVAGHPHEHPLQCVQCTHYSQKLRVELPEAVSTYEQALEELRQAAEACARELEWAVPETLLQFRRLAEMAQHFLAAQSLRGQLSQTWNDGFFQLDGQALLEEYSTINAKWFLPKLFGMNGLFKRMSVYSAAPVTKEAFPEAFTRLTDYQREQKIADTLFQSAGKEENLLGQLQESLKAPLAVFMNAWLTALSAREKVVQLLSLEETEDAPWIDSQRQLCRTLMAHADKLKEWITWNNAAAQAQELGLSPVVEAYCAGLPHEQIEPAYLKAIARGLAVRYIDKESALGMFSGAMFNEKIAQFKQMDRELIELTRQEIFCRLAANVPDCTREAAQSSELGILQRAIRSNGRGVSIRRLFEQIPNLLPRLCPCMLMSPISAAQYLDPRREPFDLVVFDEASQLPTSKAIGALARGRNAVVVGDPKQMPPTSFFAANTVDEDNLDAEDLESILDDCLALNMPQTHLLWHYRSRHESLIAFSNGCFYENKLYTFPSANDRESKVSLVPVAGTFDRGKTRQNQAEAQAVLEELKRRCHDPKLSRYSVGVVTFNISQQNLIDDLLSEACGNDPVLEQWAYGSEEPVFIKNLENVQGDERDVILFSVGYGVDQNGKVSMNFGPLNRAGGWRRLNVAVSRARIEMKVFSSLAPGQIDLSRSSAEGVAALRAFLEYAQSGRLDVDEKTLRRVHSWRTGIAEAVCAALEEKGYATQYAVGKSAYKVDIGVIDPQRPGQYLLGILLDGENYHAAKTVRDREIAQIDVLNGLGWNILRIWTMDWWDNRQKELDRIFDCLEQLKKQPPKPEVLPAVKPMPLQPPAGGRKIAGSVGRTPETPIPTVPKASEIPLYKPAALQEETLAPEDFIQPIQTRRIQEKIRCVIEQEAPVCETLLVRRVVQSFGISRTGSRIQSRMTQILSGMGLNCTEENGQIVFWRANQMPEHYIEFRASGTETAKREARDVPVQEASNAICRVLDEQISLLEEDLIREAAKLMGYARLGSVVTELFRMAILSAKRQGRIELAANGNWILMQPKRG